MLNKIKLIALGFTLLFLGGVVLVNSPLSRIFPFPVIARSTTIVGDKAISWIQNNLNRIARNDKKQPKSSPPLVRTSNNTPSVLAAKALAPHFVFTVNVESFFRENAKFNKNVDIKGTLTAPNLFQSITAGDGISTSGTAQKPTVTNTGVLSLQGKTGALSLTGSGIKIEGTTLTNTGVLSVGGKSGDVTLTNGSGIGISGTTVSNTGVTSLQSQTGSLSLTAGTGITISGLTISNSSPGTSQNTFNTINVGNTTFSAGSNTDTLTFASGSGITITPDTTGKSLTIATNGTSTSQWTTNGTNIYYNTGSVGIGATNPIATLDVRGNSSTTPAASISGDTSFAGLVVDNSGSGDLFTASKSGATKFVIDNAGNTILYGNLTLGGESISDFTGNGLALSSSALTINLPSGTDGAGTTSNSPSGLEFRNGALTLLQGCDATNKILKWNDTSNLWACGTDDGGLSTAVFEVQEGTGDLYTGLTRLRFDSEQFNLDTAPTDIGTIALVTWRRPTNTGTLVPVNITDDLLLGGTATSSSLFRVAGLTGAVTANTYNGIVIATSSSLFRVAGLTGAVTANTYNGIVIATSSGTLTVTGDSYLNQDLRVAASPTFVGLTLSGLTTNGVIINTDDVLSAEAQLGLTRGGTGRSLTAANGGVVWSDADSLEISAAGISGQILKSNGAAAPTWISASTVGTNYWQTNEGALSPLEISNDLLLGGTATSSASFHVYGASAFQGINPVASIVANTSFAALVVDNKGSGDLFTASSSGLPRFTITQNGGIRISNSSGSLLTGSTLGTASCVTTTNGIVTGSAACDTSSGSNLWDNANGTLSPKIITQDLLLGGIATSSAKFAVLNMNSDTPTASISANSGNNATYLTGTGNLATTNMQGLTLGSATTGNINVNTYGINTQTFTSMVSTGATTSGAFHFLDNSLSSGTGLSVSTMNTGFTSGKIFQVMSTANFINFSGAFANIDWSPTAATVATGDLLSINAGSNATLGSLLNIKDNDSSVFKVDQTQITSSLPQQFTAAGDVSMAYDLQFTNQSESYIKSNAPLYLESGESWESNDLTLRTFNQGNIVLDSKYVIAETGSVAIGTSSANYAFEVQNSQTATAAASIWNTAANNTAGHTGLIIKMGAAGSTTNPSANDSFVNFLQGNGRRRGSIVGNGATGVTYQTFGADYAEYFAVDPSILPIDYTDTDKAAMFPTGTLVCQGTNGIIPCSNAADPKILGVISANPGFSGGEDGRNKVMVGLLGQLSLKVSTANGTIKNGDLLTSSSTPGVAIKATKAGTIIGKALEDYSGVGSSQINAYVSTSYNDPNDILANLVFDTNGNLSTNSIDLGTPLQINGQAFNGSLNDGIGAMNNVLTTHSAQIAQTNTLINSLSDQTASASANTSALDSAITNLQTQVQNHSLQINDLESRIASLSGFLMPISPIPSLATSGAQLTLDALDVKDATVSGTLSVLGRTLLADVGITGKINAGMLTVNGLDDNGFASINTLSGPLKLQSDGLNGLDILDGKVTVDTKGNIATKGEITAKAVNTGKLNITMDTVSSPSAVLSTSAGSIVIPAGQASIDVSTNTLSPKSLIFVTPDQAITIGAKAKNSNTFTIKLQKAQAVNIKVNWWIIN